jgi:DNA-binding XRE family transcriptional regulator
MDRFATRRKLEAYIQLHPEEKISQTALAKELGVSHQRIQQMNARSPISILRVKEDILCSQCGALIKTNGFRDCSGNRTIVCSLCHQKKRDAYSTNIQKTLICGVCKNSFTISLLEYNQRKKKKQLEDFYCSHQCWGKYVGTHYGRGKPK